MRPGTGIIKRIDTCAAVDRAADAAAEECKDVGSGATGQVLDTREGQAIEVTRVCARDFPTIGSVARLELVDSSTAFDSATDAAASANYEQV
jgi:hypothetical protein